MAAYSADIVVNTRIQNQRSLNLAVSSIQKLARDAVAVKPINLFAPGAGAKASEIGKQLETIKRVARNINEGAIGPGKLSSTFAGAADQARVFSDVLANVNLKAKNAAASIDIFAQAFARAELKADNARLVFEETLDTARRALAIQTGDFSVALNPQVQQTLSSSNVPRDVERANQQINTALDLRAELYQKNVDEIKAIESGYFSLAAQSQRVQDENNEINRVLDQRAELYQKNIDEIKNIEANYFSLAAQSQRVQDENREINRVLDQRAELYQKNLEEVQAIENRYFSLAAQSQKVEEENREINRVLDQRAELYQKNLEEIRAIESRYFSLDAHSKRVQEENREVNRVLDQRAELYQKNIDEIRAIEQQYYSLSAQQERTSRASGPLGISNEDTNKLLDDRAQKIQNAIDEAANAQYEANKQVAAAEKTLQQELQNIELRGIEESTRRKIQSADRVSKEDLRLQKEANAKALRDFDEKLEKRSTIKKQRSRLREDLLLGAGFPLLFGGGLGAVLGGVGGALLGGGKGGFGAQIFGSAIGQQLDAVAQDALNTAKALTSTSSALNFVREKSLFSSKQSEELSYALEEQGDVAGLASLLTQELADKIGNNGVQSLVDLGAETDETTKLWNELTLQLQALISGPLKGFLELVNGFLTGLTTEQRFAAFQRDIAGDTQAQQRFAEIEAEVRGTTRRNVRGGGTQEVLGALTVAKQAEILNRAIAEGLRPTPSVPIIPQTPEDFRTIKPPTDRSADKARREEERLQERLKRLEAERVKILEVSRFQDKIAAAVASGNEELEIRLRGEQRISEIEQNRIKALAKVEDQREKDGININAATEKLAAQRQTERELAEAVRLRTENYENTVASLENQLNITTATTRQERERLEIAQQMKELRDSDKFTEDQLSQIEKLKKDLNAANQPLNKFIVDSTAQLNDLEQVAVNVASGIGSAIGNSLNNAISGLIEGSTTIKEVFSDMLKSIGQVLVQEGTKMIATYIAIGIARAFAGFGKAPDAGDAMSGTGFLPQITKYDTMGPFRANGGPVQGGQPYMVGERGPELFVPSSNGGVMRNEDMRQLMGRSPVGNAPAMNFTFETTNIGGQEFVSREQLEAAMATTRRQAANDGAKRGMNMTLDRMQNSPRTRARVGIA
jgi:hypothetical protein